NPLFITFNGIDDAGEAAVVAIGDRTKSSVRLKSNAAILASQLWRAHDLDNKWAMHLDVAPVERIALETNGERDAVFEGSQMTSRNPNDTALGANRKWCNVFPGHPVVPVPAHEIAANAEVEAPFAPIPRHLTTVVIRTKHQAQRNF